MDEQSNVSLARAEFFDMFNVDNTLEPYTLKTCAGVMETSGRREYGFVVESIDKKISLSLPTLIECNAIPNNRKEIPTPEAAWHHQHLRPIAEQIPPLDPDAEILLLIGRDLLRVHKVRKQFNGKHNDPYAQKLDLGWVIVGDVCLGNTHKPAEVSVMKTHIFPPCFSHIIVKEKLGFQNIPKAIPPQLNVSALATESTL